MPKSIEVRRPLVPPKRWEDLEPFIRQRIELGLTQGQVAGAMSASATHVSQAERGVTNISARFVERYREAIERCRRALAGEGGA